MQKNVFLEELQKQGVPMISRFLGVTPQEVIHLIRKKQLRASLDETYKQMPGDELERFEAELLIDGFAAKAKNEARIFRRGITPQPTHDAPRWSKIKYDHHDETDGFIVAYIDAWNTDADDEEGEVIAQVVGTNHNGNPETHTVYIHPEARFDTPANDAIKQAQQDVVSALRKAPTQNQPVIRRTRVDDGHVISVYLSQETPGQRVSQALVRITTLRQQSGNVPEPVVKHLYPVMLSDAFIKAIAETVQELKTSPTYL